MAFGFKARVAHVLSIVLLLLIFNASAPSAQEDSTTPSDANALFVAAVLKYREAEGLTGSEAGEAYREVRRLFDILLLDHPDSRPAAALRTEQTPGGVDLGKLPILDDVNEPEGWNAGKRDIARDLLRSYQADLKRIESVAAAADFATLASAAYAETYTDSAIASAAERGWTVVWRFEKASPENPLVGAATAVLFRSDRGTHVLSFRGSKTAGDWVTNINGSLSVSSLSNAQVSAAREIAQEVVATHPETILVGHSLGGRLAQVARLATGNAAVVFNTATLGANDRIRALLDKSEPATSLINFRSPEDPLTSIFSPTDIEVSNIALVEGGGLVDAINADYSHSMDVLAEAMQAVRLAHHEGWMHRLLFETRAAGSEVPSTSSQLEIEDTPRVLTGDWQTSGWILRFQNNTASILKGGDANRPPHSEIFKVQGIDGVELRGNWRYRDGVWRYVSGTINTDSIEVRDGTNRWSLSKIEFQGAPTESLSSNIGSGMASSDLETMLTGDWHFGNQAIIRFQSGVGLVLKPMTGDYARPSGIAILRIQTAASGSFQGTWRDRGGNWVPVRGQVTKDMISLEGEGQLWQLQRTKATSTLGSAIEPSPLDGDWIPVKNTNLSFRFTNMVGTVISGGSRSQSPGSEFLRIQEIKPSSIKGYWLNSNGKWELFLAGINGDTIEYGDRNNPVVWVRADRIEAYNSEQFAKTQPADFSAWGEDQDAQRAIADIRSMPVLVVADECGEVRGPLKLAHMKALFQRRWLSLRNEHRAPAVDFQQIVNADEIYDQSLRIPSVETSSYYVFMCSKGRFPFVATRTAVENKWFPVKIIGAIPVPREPLGTNTSYIAAVGKARTPIPVANIAGCTTASQDIQNLSHVKWSGSCKNGTAVGEGVFEWWDQRRELVWKTFVGERYWTIIDDGRLRDPGRVIFELREKEIFLELAQCSEYGSVVRLELPASLPTEIYTVRSLVPSLRARGEAFARKHCPNTDYRGASIFRGNREKPDISWNDQEDRFPIATQFSSDFLREGREIKKREERAAIELQAEALKKTYEGNRNIAEANARLFLKSGKGTLEMIISALEIDEVSTLQRLEEGILIGLEPGESMQSSQVDGKQKYTVPYSVVSPFERLERQLKTDLANIRYTSQFDLIFDMSANPIPRRMRLTCTFSSLSDVPKERTVIRASLVSYSSGRDGYSVSLNCRK